MASSGSTASEISGVRDWWWSVKGAVVSSPSASCRPSCHLDQCLLCGGLAKTDAVRWRDGEVISRTECVTKHVHAGRVWRHQTQCNPSLCRILRDRSKRRAFEHCGSCPLPPTHVRTTPHTQNQDCVGKALWGTETRERLTASPRPRSNF